MSDFKPPIENRAFLSLCKWGLPLEMNLRARIAVHVEGDGLERLKAARKHRSVLVCNHSDQFDPEVTFALSKMLGEDFYFVAAREVFDWVHGLVGWCFQNLGCYSVVRGQADYESFRMTKDILVKGKRRLVMYPEGEVTRQPDRILPLRKGAFKLFMEAQEELKEQSGEPLYVVPIAIRWTYRDDIRPRLHAALRRVESKLRIIPPSGDIISRIEYASQVMASILEEEYSAKPQPHLPFDRRIIALRAHILKTMAAGLNVELPEDEGHLDWLRRLNNALDSFVKQDMTDKPEFQRRLHKEVQMKAERLRGDLIRVQHLIGVSDKIDPRPLTGERLAHRVAQLEREVLGKVSYKGVRLAMITVGEPISLLDYYEDYKADNDHAVEAISKRVRAELQELIDRLDVIQQKDYAASLPR